MCCVCSIGFDTASLPAFIPSKKPSVTVSTFFMAKLGREKRLFGEDAVHEGYVHKTL